MEALIVVAVRLVSWAVVAVVFIIEVMKPLAQLIVLLPYLRLSHFTTSPAPRLVGGSSPPGEFDDGLPMSGQSELQLSDADVGPSPEVQRIVKLVDREREMAVRVLRGWMNEG